VRACDEIRHFSCSGQVDALSPSIIVPVLLVAGVALAFLGCKPSLSSRPGSQLRDSALAEPVQHTPTLKIPHTSALAMA
jgi:hypothetical protein